MSNLTTRSRTNLFLSYRDSRVSYSSKGKGRATYEDEELEDEQTGLMTTDLELGHSSHLPPQWIDLSSKVDAILLGLKPKL